MGLWDCSQIIETLNAKYMSGKIGYCFVLLFPECLKARRFGENFKIKKKPKINNNKIEPSYFFECTLD